LNLFANEVFDFHNYILALFFCLRSFFGVPYPAGTAVRCGSGTVAMTCQCGAGGHGAEVGVDLGTLWKIPGAWASMRIASM